MRTALLLTVAMALAACDSDFPGEAPPDDTLLASTEWKLVVLPGQPVQPETMLSFDSPRAFDGRAACNSYSGTYLAQSGGFSGPLFSASVESVTEMACGDGLNEYESAYFAALRSAVRWSVEEGRLRLTLPNGAGELEFVRAE
jgi:heat shock protein HslJ